MLEKRCPCPIEDMNQYILVHTQKNTLLSYTFMEVMRHTTRREPISERKKGGKITGHSLPLLQSNGVKMWIPKQEGCRAFWEHQRELFQVH